MVNIIFDQLMLIKIIIKMEENCHAFGPGQVITGQVVKVVRAWLT